MDGLNNNKSDKFKIHFINRRNKQTLGQINT